MCCIPCCVHPDRQTPIGRAPRRYIHTKPIVAPAACARAVRLPPSLLAGPFFSVGKHRTGRADECEEDYSSPYVHSFFFFLLIKSFHSHSHTHSLFLSLFSFFPPGLFPLSGKFLPRCVNEKLQDDDDDDGVMRQTIGGASVTSATQEQTRQLTKQQERYKVKKKLLLRYIRLPRLICKENLFSSGALSPLHRTSQRLAGQSVVLACLFALCARWCNMIEMKAMSDMKANRRAAQGSTVQCCLVLARYMPPCLVHRALSRTRMK